MNTEEKNAKLQAKVAVGCVVLTIIVQIAGSWYNSRERRSEELMSHRRAALISVLQVVDNVYSNVSMNGHPPSSPHQWEASLARDAMNNIIIYCKDPNRVLYAFGKAVGLHNPETQKPTEFGPKGLAELRDVICQELELKPIHYESPDVVWIYRLPGAK